MLDCGAILFPVNDQEDNALHVIARSPHFQKVREYIDDRKGRNIVEDLGRLRNKKGKFPDVQFISIEEVVEQVDKEIQDLWNGYKDLRT